MHDPTLMLRVLVLFLYNVAADRTCPIDDQIADQLTGLLFR